MESPPSPLPQVCKPLGDGGVIDDWRWTSSGEEWYLAQISAVHGARLPSALAGASQLPDLPAWLSERHAQELLGPSQFEELTRRFVDNVVAKSCSQFLWEHGDPLQMMPQGGAGLDLVVFVLKLQMKIEWSMVGTGFKKIISK